MVQMVSFQDPKRWFLNCNCTAKDKIIDKKLLVHL
jgi:hypothetical protein